MRSRRRKPVAANSYLRRYQATSAGLASSTNTCMSKRGDFGLNCFAVRYRRTRSNYRFVVILDKESGNAAKRARSVVGGRIPPPASGHRDRTINARRALGRARGGSENRLVRFLSDEDL